MYEGGYTMMLTCHRCGGLMSTTYERQDVDIVVMYKCLNCGEVVDPTILRNRQQRPLLSWGRKDMAQERPRRMDGCGPGVVPPDQRPIGREGWTGEDGRYWHRRGV